MSSPSASPGVLLGSPAFGRFLGDLEPNRCYALAGLAFLIGMVVFTSTRSHGPYDIIPAVGGTGFFSSYLSAIQFFRNGERMIQEGYDKYTPGVFRYPELNRWHLVASGEAFVEEIRKAPDDALSFEEAVIDDLAVKYTMGPNIVTNSYHIGIMRGALTRNLGALIPEVQDEVSLAFQDHIPAVHEWTPVKVLETAMKIISRTSNRMIVGAPTCRDPEYVALNIQFAIDVMVGAKAINLFPKFLRPLSGRLFTNVPKALKTGMKHLKPVIEERRKNIDEYGTDYPDKPNDFLSWLMDEAKGEERSVRSLTLRVLVVNFAAIHTTSMGFTHAVFNLAARPEYIQPIREEVEAAIAAEGWSKAAMTRMRKLDSFLKESARLYPLGALTMTRKAVRDYTFADGTRIPKGSVVSVASLARHRDAAVHRDARAFDGLRFSAARAGAGQGTKHQMVATGTEFLTFGHGRHACPGRFFAAHALKGLMAHVVLTYDVKLATGVRPENRWYGSICVPDREGEVLFRKRQS